MTPLIHHHRTLLIEALSRLNIYSSSIEMLPPGSSASKVVDKCREKYIEALTEVVKHAHELTTGYNVVASWPVNAEVIQGLS